MLGGGGCKTCWGGGGGCTNEVGGGGAHIICLELTPLSLIN